MGTQVKERRANDEGKTKRVQLLYLWGRQKRRKKGRKSNCQSLAFKHMSVPVWKQLKVILHLFIIINPINHPQVLSAAVKTT